MYQINTTQANNGWMVIVTKNQPGIEANPMNGLESMMKNVMGMAAKVDDNYDAKMAAINKSKYEGLHVFKTFDELLAFFRCLQEEVEK